MSVLIEAMTLVVARHALDADVPGGTAAFLTAATARPDVRYAIADTYLVAVSTVAPAALDALGNQLAPYGIHRRDGGVAVLVDTFHLDEHDGAVSAPGDRLRVLLHPDSTPALLRVDVVLPCVVSGRAGDHTAANLAAMARISVRHDVEQLSAHLDPETGTIALIATIPRRRRESLVRAVGRAFALAVRMGTAGTHGARHGESVLVTDAMTPI